MLTSSSQLFSCYGQDLRHLALRKIQSLAVAMKRPSQQRAVLEFLVLWRRVMRNTAKTQHGNPKDKMDVLASWRVEV